MLNSPEGFKCCFKCNQFALTGLVNNVLLQLQCLCLTSVKFLLISFFWSRSSSDGISKGKRCLRNRRGWLRKEIHSDNVASITSWNQTVSACKCGEVVKGNITQQEGPLPSLAFTKWDRQKYRIRWLETHRPRPACYEALSSELAPCAAITSRCSLIELIWRIYFHCGKYL